MKSLMRIAFIFAISLFTQSLFGQTTPTSPAKDKITGKQATQNPELWRKKQEIMVEESFDKLRQLENSKDERTEFLPELQLPFFSKEQKRLIAVSKTDETLYAEFLKQPKTEIIKLISDIDCGSRYVVDVNNPNCINRANMDLSYYSFRKKLHSSLAWADLYYQDKKFLVSFDRFVIGMIAEVNDIEIETITKEADYVKTLLELPFPKTRNGITEKKTEIEIGLTVNGKIFSNKINAENGKTYILRSYAYQSINDARNDRRIDIIVALKVVGIDQNNSVTIIWKELHTGKTVNVKNQA